MPFYTTVRKPGAARLTGAKKIQPAGGFSPPESAQYSQTLA
jgi:hypothetical protein